MKVGPDHTFGMMVKPDSYGAGDLLHGRAMNKYLRGKEHQRGVVTALRQQLKKANFQNFGNLLSAFRFYDKVCLPTPMPYNLSCTGYTTEMTYLYVFYRTTKVE